MDASSIANERWAPTVGAQPQVILEYSAGSHVGTVRSLNEDAFLAGPPVFVVADGMGGYARGDVASAMVVDAFEALVGDSQVKAEDLDAAISRSRRAIADLAEDADSAGSTVVAAAYVIESGHAYWLLVHEGDSRAYTFGHGRLRQVTRDHSIVQELVDAGEIEPHEARLHPARHVVTRAVGALIDTQPEFTLVPVEVGARVLLCSDGLTSELSEESIAVLLGRARTSQEAVDALLRAAVQAGGHDNVTALVIEVVAPEDGETREDTLVPRRVVREDTTPKAMEVP